MTLALLLFGAAGDARGASGLPPEEVPAARTKPRLHAGVAIGGIFAAGGYTLTASAILTGDVGVVLNDKLSLFARAEGGTAFLSLVLGGSLGAAYDLSDRFNVGAGLKIFGWQPVSYDITPGPFLGVMLPLRATFAPFNPRSEGDVARSGLVLGLEVAPGIGVLTTAYSPFGKPADAEFGISAAVTVGFATW